MENTSSKGTVGEFAIATYAAKNGYWVGFMSQQCPYDLIIDRGEGPIRVQVKYRKERRGVVMLELDTTYKSKNNTEYTSSNVDYIALYEPSSNKIAWIPIEECESKKSISLRLGNTKNNQKVGVNMFCDYEKF